MKKAKTKHLCPICCNPYCPLTAAYLRASESKEKKDAKQRKKEENQ
jgi:hypothetical protein